jgi:hypothetical protein
VSDELSHFFGHRLTDEQGYSQLLSILQSGWLRAGGGRTDTAGEMMISTTGLRALCSDKMFIQDIVCFCDIPPADFGIHMEKYGRFGVSFRKPWLIAKGANPVFYVAAGDSPVILKDKPNRPRADLFNEEVDRLSHLAALVEEGLEKYDEELSPQAMNLNQLISFFLHPHVFAFIKCFDPALAEDDPDNFYMEREWRVLGAVSFQRSDVRRVILPEELAGRLREDVPDYTGQVEFSPILRTG